MRGVREMAISGSGKSLGLGFFSRCSRQDEERRLRLSLGKRKVIMRYRSFVVGVLPYTVALLLFSFLLVTLGSRGEVGRARVSFFSLFVFFGGKYTGISEFELSTQTFLLFRIIPRRTVKAWPWVTSALN